MMMMTVMMMMTMMMMTHEWLPIGNTIMMFG
jgi:hypothetical protein